ncbi:DUF6082 family protein [Streptomyces canus]|uniref:DUF6082 family protein n=1 Tax=Streptomyces canus TaxID=58343 RepID=UPI0037111002
MAIPQQEDLLRELVGVFGRMAGGLFRIAEEMHRANLIQTKFLYVEQMDRSLDDPVLAASLSTLSHTSDNKRRQMLFANRHYGLLLLSYRIGDMDRSELLGHLKVLSMNSVFVEYWRLTSEHRRQLPPDSLEARTGRAVDAVMKERLDDLEEWRIVGTESDSTPD